MDAEDETEREERLRNLYATLATDLGYTGDNQLRRWLEAGAVKLEQFFAFLGDWICECIEGLGRRYGPFWRLRWSLYYPWSSRNRNLRDLKRAKQQLKQICGKKATPTQRRAQLARTPFVKLRRAVIGKTANRSPFFTKLPPEIRRMILAEAFGNQTIHLDLSLRYPFYEMKGQPRIIQGKRYHYCAHAKIRPLSFERYNVDSDRLDEKTTFDTTKRKKWRWLSCVCHRQLPTAKRLAFGRRHNMNHWGSTFKEPHFDRCLAGRGYCTLWPGEWPSKCFVGVYGWLLSCRQAILFQLNTFFISSPVLLLGIQDILGYNIIGMMTSLDLVFDKAVLDLSETFTGLPPKFGIKSMPENGKFVFPSLQQLRISFVETRQFTDPWTGEYLPIGFDFENRDVITMKTLPELDSLLQRIVPPSAEVTVSCPHPRWYVEIENKLISQQGRVKTQSQPAELGGEKCWREIPNIDCDTQGIANSSVEALLSDTLIAGYWIHSLRNDLRRPHIA
ncbi:unnamed protein product [Clonostachys rhizophaga]|uniref:DUF7730 domain-containing protein n=1 Tax=Clonostachys rhizophaga TaxID=160324 RepID=A0A9N9VTW7_9HYPO|nr:unnamed protein product [Clonostachys rhizophaga]